MHQNYPRSRGSSTYREVKSPRKVLRRCGICETTGGERANGCTKRLVVGPITHKSGSFLDSSSNRRVKVWSTNVISQIERMASLLSQFSTYLQLTTAAKPSNVKMIVTPFLFYHYTSWSKVAFDVVIMLRTSQIRQLPKTSPQAVKPFVFHSMIRWRVCIVIVV